MAHIEDKRFCRTRAFLGDGKLKNLQDSTVMIIGLGAVGGYALEGIARAGVEHLILVDFDKFEESNINRQILATNESIGKSKAKVAADRIKSINPHANIEEKPVFVDEKNIDDLLNCKVDFVVDAIDSLPSKCSLIKALVAKKIPFISSMGAALKQDFSKIKVCNLNQTQGDSLARELRRRLKAEGVDLSQINCVSSTETPIKQSNTEKVDEQGRTRPVLGSLPTITAIFGLIIAGEAIKYLSERK